MVNFKSPESEVVHSYGHCSNRDHIMLELYAVLYVDTTGTVSVRYTGVIVMTTVTLSEVDGSRKISVKEVVTKTSKSVN